MNDTISFSLPTDPEERQEVMEYFRNKLEEECTANLVMTPIAVDDEKVIARVVSVEAKPSDAADDGETEDSPIPASVSINLQLPS